MPIHEATLVSAAVKRPRYESHHAGADPKAEREARELRMNPAHWELRIRGEQLMLDYLAGAPSQRKTALGASIDRNAIMGGTSRICERCEGSGILRPKPGGRGSKQLLELIDVVLPNEPACAPRELIGAPKQKNDKADHDYAIVESLAAAAGCAMEDVLRTFEPWCPACSGNGVIARPKPAGTAITVRPTGSSKEPWREHDDRLGELVNFGRASKVMREATIDEPVFEMALVSYFGTTGVRWAGSVFGKVFAVYPFTASGQRLLERTRNRAGEQDPWDRIWSLATDTNKRRDVQALVDAAGLQAVTLLQRAGNAWDRVVVRMPARSAA